MLAGRLERDRVESFPGDRQIRIRDARQGLRVAHQGADRFAAMACDALGQNRLILSGGVDAVQIASRNVGRRQHADQSGMGGPQRAEIAERETRMGMWAANGPQREAWLLRQRVGPEPIRAGDFSAPVHLREPRAYCCAGLGFWTERFRNGPNRQHGLDDFAIAGAAAEHAGQSLPYFRLAGRRCARQQVGRRHQHPRRADAALRGPLSEEGGLQRSQIFVLRQAFDGYHGSGVHPGDRDEAGAQLPAIHQDGAGAAIAGVAADLGSGQS